MRKIIRSPLVYALFAVLVLLVVFNVLRGGPSRTSISLGQYQQDLAVPGKVTSAVIHDGSGDVTGKLKDGTAYVVQYPDRYAPDLTTKVLAAVPGAKVAHSHSNPWLSALGSYGPILLIFGVFLFLMNSMQGGGSRVMQFGKAKARTGLKDQPKVTFADVAGTDEAVAELQEIKEFLEAPGRFHALGAKIPRGVLLFGPPGTGKTLLARAVAGEAGVPFFSISGSDFVEMFVGVGASRVRDLFEQAKANSPAIVFMDEIDAVGRHRGAGMGGGHDEREQTLNQLLVEMDGFDARGGVILIAATNRPDILDPALLRPGRFDRQIVVDRPDVVGRRKILDVHAQGKPLGPAVDLDVLAKRTPGFTGADLANLLNEAAILTARRNLKNIGMRECEEAIDRVLAGPERKTLVMSEHDKLVTAYHEAGHVIVGHVLTHADAIHKVSIVARSRSLGLTFTLPEDKFNHSRSELRDAMAMCMGGRSAEELVFDEPTTGAENDIEKATRVARSMVTEYGMSERLGPQQLGQGSGEVFLGRDFGHQANYSEDVAGAIDAEVRELIEQAHARARDILAAHRGVLDALARELVEKETLETPDLMAIIGHLDPWPVIGDGNGRRPPSRAAPVTVPVPSAGLARPGVAQPAGTRRSRPLRARSDAGKTAGKAPAAAPSPALARSNGARPRSEPPARRNAARRDPGPEKTAGAKRPVPAPAPAKPKAAPAAPSRSRARPRPGASEP